MMLDRRRRQRPRAEDSPRGFDGSTLVALESGIEAVKQDVFRYNNGRVRDYYGTRIRTPCHHSLSDSRETLEQLRPFENVLQERLRRLAQHDGRQFGPIRTVHGGVKTRPAEQVRAAAGRDTLAANHDGG